MKPPPIDQQYFFGQSTPNRRDLNEKKIKAGQEIKEYGNASKIPFASPDKVKASFGTPNLSTRTAAAAVPSTPLSASSTWKNVGSESRKPTDFRSPLADNKSRKLNQIGTRGTPKEKEADSKLQQVSIMLFSYIKMKCFIMLIYFRIGFECTINRFRLHVARKLASRIEYSLELLTLLHRLLLQHHHILNHNQDQ